VAAAIPFLSNRSRLHEMGLAAAYLVREKFTFQRQVNET
jgi:hypothetical protein